MKLVSFATFLKEQVTPITDNTQKQKMINNAPKNKWENLIDSSKLSFDNNMQQKDLTDDAYESLAKKVFDLCKREDITFFLHTKIEIARKIGCQNIHLSIPVLKGLSETEKKALTEDFCEISISCHSMEDVEIAMAGGATQIILGTIFETECKKGVLGKGVEFVREICQKCPLPVYAIGGMNLQRLPLVIDAGAAGCCMMSGFMQTTKTLQ